MKGMYKLERVSGLWAIRNPSGRITESFKNHQEAETRVNELNKGLAQYINTQK